MATRIAGVMRLFSKEYFTRNTIPRKRTNPPIQAKSFTPKNASQSKGLGGGGGGVCGAETGGAVGGGGRGGIGGGVGPSGSVTTGDGTGWTAARGRGARARTLVSDAGAAATPLASNSPTRRTRWA